MKKQELQMLFAYNRWANKKVLTACQRVSEAELMAPVGLSFDSLYGTMLHLAGSEMIWRARMAGQTITRMPDAAEMPDLPVLQSWWQAEELRMQSFLDQIEPGTEEHVIHFQRLNGGMESATLWKALLHLALHSMQFRAEAGTVLSRLGASPGDIDLLLFLRENDQR